MQPRSRGGGPPRQGHADHGLETSRVVCLPPGGTRRGGRTVAPQGGGGGGTDARRRRRGEGAEMGFCAGPYGC